MSNSQKSSYSMPKSCYQSISNFMACDDFCAIVNEIYDLNGISISSNLSWASVSLVDTVMP